MPNGAIARWPDQPLQAVIPYWSSYAAMGLSRAAQVTGNTSDAAAAWAYLDWYASEENAAGYVTDFTVVDNTTLVSTGSMDSTDAYAGTFLTAAWDTFVADPDPNELQRLLPGVRGAVRAVESTQGTSGLTNALPDYDVAYLMDNAEVYGGLLSAERLAGAAGVPDLAARASRDAAALNSGWSRLWDPAETSFPWAVTPDGTVSATDWDVLYPDSMAQAWAAAYGLASPSQAAQIVPALTRYEPEWDQPTASAIVRIGSNLESAPVDYWPIAGLALARVGEVRAAATAADQIAAAATAASSAWPFTVGNAGQMIILVTGGSVVAPAA
jgi:hypothetical protein